jgi:hypothetical protein
MLATLVLFENAPMPRVVIVKPLVELGMITTAFVPAYPVMVIAPLLVVKVNWASTTAGMNKSSKD